MALITCPECGKEISDKSDKCIHCGYPLNNVLNCYYDVIYNGFSYPKLKCDNQAKLIGCLRKIMGERSLSEYKRIIDSPPYTLFRSLSKENADWVYATLEPFRCSIEIKASTSSPEESDNHKLDAYVQSGGTVVCPRCGSNQIATGQRGYSLFTGFLGSSRTMNRCAKCGYSWQPK